MSNAWMIAAPVGNIPLVVSLCSQALGYSPARAVDGSPRKLSDGERWLSVLASVWDERAPVGLDARLLHFATASVFALVDARDLDDVLHTAGPLSALVRDTVRPGVSVLILSGPLNAWRDVVQIGLAPDSASREVWLSIFGEFERVGLAGLWPMAGRHYDQTGQLFLESK